MDPWRAHNVALRTELDVSLAWQDVTIRLIAQRGVFHGKAPPSTRRHWSLSRFFQLLAPHSPSVTAPSATTGSLKRLGSFLNRNANELYLEDETARIKVSLPPPLNGRKHHLFCSEFNAGAVALANELRESNVFVTKGKKASARLSITTAVDELADCDHMLVLLDKRTWTSGADTAKFVEHIHTAMRIGVHITCVHEFPAVVGLPRHACDFALMFGDDWTPAHLTGGPTNLYKEVDVALKGAEWRQPGLVAWASTLATSSGEHKPIDVRVPKSYKARTGANPWLELSGAVCSGSQAVPSQALPEPVGAAHASEARVTQAAAAALPTALGSQESDDHSRASLVGRARADSLAEDPSTCWLSMRPSSSKSEGPYGEVSLGAAAVMRAPPPRAAPPPRPDDEVELASMPVPPLPTSEAEAAPAYPSNNPMADFVSHRLLGLFSAPEASKRLEA